MNQSALQCFLWNDVPPPEEQLLLLLTTAVSGQLNIITALLSPQQPARSHPPLFRHLCLIVGLLTRTCTTQSQSCDSVWRWDHRVASKGINNRSAHYFASILLTLLLITFCPSFSGPTLLSVAGPHAAGVDWRFNNAKRFTAPAHLAPLSLSSLPHYWNDQVPSNNSPACWMSHGESEEQRWASESS